MGCGTRQWWQWVVARKAQQLKGWCQVWHCHWVWLNRWPVCSQGDHLGWPRDAAADGHQSSLQSMTLYLPHNGRKCIVMFHHYQRMVLCLKCSRSFFNQVLKVSLTLGISPFWNLSGNSVSVLTLAILVSAVLMLYLKSLLRSSQGILCQFGSYA